MPSANKRARKKENARAAREQREAALRRKKRTRSGITVAVVVAIFVGVIVLLNVAGGGGKKKTAATTTTTTTDPKLDATKVYVAQITTNYGVIEIELDPKKAPIGAAHFADLIQKKAYDGSRFHRIIKGFVIQGGAPGGDPTKQYGHPVIAEVPKGKYALGDVAAAKTNSDTSGTFDSEFFIVTGPQGEALPDQYADFAHVTGGLNVVRKIEALKTDAGDQPTKPATIEKITITRS